jgi:hypothetical protein
MRKNLGNGDPESDLELHPAKTWTWTRCEEGRERIILYF